MARSEDVYLVTLEGQLRACGCLQILILAVIGFLGGIGLIMYSF